jgi:hypothetical protein
MREIRNAYEFSVENLEWKKEHMRPRCREESIIQIDIR